MASALPKFKLYMLISIISIVLNIGFTIYTYVINGSFDILPLLTGFGTGFIPFVSTISLVFSFGSIPAEVIALFGVVTIIIGIVQTYLVVIIVANFIPTINV